MSEQFKSGEGYRCGFIAVIGRPNVGKSTLINYFVGRKVSIVSPRPQTTRHRILGVHTTDEAQMIFIDTPGMHSGEKKAINRMMNRTAVSALADADAILWLLEAGVWTQSDEQVLERLESVQTPVIAVLNKVDLLFRKEDLLPFIASIQGKREFVSILPVSVLKDLQMQSVTQQLMKLLPESSAMFPTDMQTDRSQSFQFAEIVREKLTLRLRQELPYGLTVQIEQLKEDENNRLIVNAVIFVERESQKGIVVGKGGLELKAVGSSARREMMRLTGRSIHLELWVKVKENWADNEQDLQRLGYEFTE